MSGCGPALNPVFEQRKPEGLTHVRDRLHRLFDVAGARLASSGVPMTVMSASWIVLGVATTIGCPLTAVLLSTPSIRMSALSVALFCGAVGAWLVGFEGALYPLLASFFVGLGGYARDHHRLRKTADQQCRLRPRFQPSRDLARCWPTRWAGTRRHACRSVRFGRSHHLRSRQLRIGSRLAVTDACFGRRAKGMLSRDYAKRDFGGA